MRVRVGFKIGIAANRDYAVFSLESAVLNGFFVIIGILISDVKLADEIEVYLYLPQVRKAPGRYRPRAFEYLITN